MGLGSIDGEDIVFPIQVWSYSFLLLIFVSYFY